MKIKKYDDLEREREKERGGRERERGGGDAGEGTKERCGVSILLNNFSI